jgi:predicted transcriptional regulator of viral defense system
MEYLPTYGSKSLIQRIGYLLDSFGFNLTAGDKERLLSWCKGSKTYLFKRKPNTPAQVQHYSKDWQLVVNAPGFWLDKPTQEKP